MIDMVYQLLAKVGFHHPLHPAITHLPMGMTMGAFIFRFTSLILKKDDLIRTGHYCITVALIFVLPTMLLGYMDWQYKWDAEWSNLILIKIILAFLFLVLLSTAFVLGRKESGKPTTAVTVLYVLCVMNAIGLGFTGGEIQYG